MIWKENHLAALFADAQLGLLFVFGQAGPNDFVLVFGTHHHIMRVFQGTADAFEDLLEIEGADVGPKNEHADNESGIADAVGDERLVGGVGGTLALIIETDEQVGANTHQLPAQKDLEEIVC